MRFLARFLFVLAAFLPPAAMAAEGYYGSFSGLRILPSNSDWSVSENGVKISTGKLGLENGFGVAAAYGYENEAGMRGEVEIGYRTVDIDELSTDNLGSVSADGDLGTLSLMANGYFVVDGRALKPYFGGGVGFARHDVELKAVAGADGDDTVLAYQMMVGVGYELSETAEARLGYRLFETADADFDGTDTSYKTHNIEVGIVFRF